MSPPPVRQRGLACSRVILQRAPETRMPLPRARRGASILRLGALGAGLAGALWAAAMLGAAAPSPPPRPPPAPPAAPRGVADADAAALRLLERVPASARTVVVVRDGAAVIADLAGSPPLQIALQFGLMAETRAAWDKLSATLGWSARETLERLAGGQAVFLSAEPTDPADPGSVPWALLSTVSGSTERRLRERLAAIPQGVLADQIVLAVEEGSHLLAVRPRDPRAGDPPPGAPEARGFHLLVAPAASRALFDELLLALAGEPKDPLSRAPAMAELRQRGPGSLTALSTEPPPPGQAAWQNFLLLRIEVDSGGYHAEVFARDSRLAERLAGVPLSSDALVPPAPPPGAPGPSAPAAVIFQARSSDASSPLAPWLVPFPGVGEAGPLGGASAALYLLHRAAPAAPGALFAAWLDGAPSEPTPGLDAAMAQVARALEAHAGSRPAPALVLEGVAADIPRKTTLRFAGPSLPGRLLGPAPVLAYRRHAATPAQAWFTCTISSDPGSAGPAGESLVAQLAAPGQSRWLSRGMVRPWLLADLAGPIGAAGPFPTLFARTDVLAWWLRAEDATTLRGEVLLRLRPAD